MTEPGFRFHDETTDSTPMPSDRHVTVDWADPDRVVDVENMLCERYSRMLSDIAADTAPRTLDGDTRDNLLTLTALMHAANHVFEMVGPLLAAQFMDDDPPAWLPRTLGCATMDEYLALMPDARIVHEARLNALATGEPQRVFLKDAGVEIAVTPTGEVTV